MSPRMRWLRCALTILTIPLLLQGCTAQKSRTWSTFHPKPEQAPSIHYCFDTVGHRTGAKPYILGGSCVCTPSELLLKDYQAHGYFVGLSFDEFLQRYKELGVQTGRDHQECNNMCLWGPHLVKGGTCMVPPVPGTTNYEEVLSGRFSPLPASDKAKKQNKYNNNK